MNRPTLAGLVLVLTVAGCARPGTPQPVSALPSATAPPVLSWCYFPPPASPSPTVPRRPARSPSSAPARAPSPTASHSLTVDQQWAQRQADNNAFRQRRPLPQSDRAASKPYADAVCGGLQRLRAAGHYDTASIRAVLTDAGLSEVQVRPRGRLDLAGSGGLLFSGWTGAACVFGEHGPTTTEVEVGSQIADGGCLPAPD